MRLHGFSKFLAPILLIVLTVVMADEETGRDSNLYQFLDLTRVENSHKNENRNFKWLGKLRRSNKNQKSVEQPISQPEEQYEPAAPKRPLLQAAFKIAPLSFHKPGKKSKESTYIVLPPLPSANEAKSVGSQGPHPIYVSKQDGGIIQPGPPYYGHQTQSAPTGPVQNTQQTPSYNSPPNSPVAPNAESEYDAEIVSPPAQHSDSRYSKWFSKLKRRKSNQPQPEKPQHHESEQLQDKPPHQGSGVIPETIFYYQNESPYNNQPSQPVATQNQPGNGQSPTSLRQPQIATSPSPQLAPARPANIQPQSAPPTHPGVFSSQINFDSRDNLFPQSITEVLEQPPPPSGNLYSKLMKKMKRNKTQKPEPVKAVGQAEPIFSPIQTGNIPPSDPTVYRPSQSAPQQTPPRPAANIVKPQPTATNLPSDPAIYRRPQSPSHLSPPGPANIVKPQPTASPPVPHSSHHQQAANKPALTTPPGNSHTKRPPVEKQPPHPLFPESETFFSSSNRPDFIPTPFQKQTEKGQGNNKESSADGFFEFGIFPNSNDFFEQNFEG